MKELDLSPTKMFLSFSLRLQIHLVIHFSNTTYIPICNRRTETVGKDRYSKPSRTIPFVLTSAFNRATNRLARQEWQE